MPHRLPRLDPYLPEFGCAFVVLALMGMCLLPLIALDVMEQALRNLHLSGPAVLLTMLGILVGGLINLPVYRIEHDEAQPVLRGYFLPGWGWVPLPRAPQQTIVAVNVGGCLIPAALAWYEAQLVWNDPQARGALVVAILVNVAVCFWLARPIAGLGIAVPALVPPLVAVVLAWLLLGHTNSELRAPVAFVAGVCGPLVGADLLHLREFTRVPAGIISIGGAGTFDGIVISGLAAAFLA
jgi:uncharacterized membrane protein